MEKAASSWITTCLESWGSMRGGMTEAFFLNAYGLPLLQAMVGLGEPKETPRHIERDLVREAAAVELRSSLDRKFEEGDLEEAALRALIYVRLPDGAFDERSFRMLKSTREQRKSNDRITRSQLREMLNVQLQLVQLDEERAIEAVPKLLRGGEHDIAATWNAMRQLVAAPGALDREGQRRWARSSRSCSARSLGQAEAERSEMSKTATQTTSVSHDKYDRLIAAAQKETTIKVAVAHPCDEVSLRGVVEATNLRLVDPILVGPVERVRSVAAQSNIDISALELVNSEHSEDSAAKAVELVTAGKVEALMKGSLHTDELMGAVVSRQFGIRTARRISHCFVMDVPGYSDALIISDAAVNIAPDLDAKVDIVQNAIDLAHAMGLAEVRVAILSAMETVTAKVPSTIEAAALCKMADRGQITGAILDGPLALDNAISPEAAAVKKIASPVAGRANVLVVPDLEAGNMLAKSLSFLANANAAGIVLGARVPIILTSRADSLISRLASCAVAVMVDAARRKSVPAAIR